MALTIPTVLNSPSGDKYHVLRQLYSSVYIARNITNLDDAECGEAEEDGKGTRLVAVKFESKKDQHHSLDDRTHAYNSLAGGPGIPFIHCSGVEDNYRYIIQDLLGPSLRNMFIYCQRNFTLKTILLIADQALSRLEFIHSQSFAHGDIKTENLLMGSGKFGTLLHLINTACKSDSYLDAESLFRADLESLGYVLLHFAWQELSWEDLKLRPTELLCRRLPTEFASYFNYINGLPSEEGPNYSHIRKIFADLFHRKRFKKDYVFDWTIRKYQELDPKGAGSLSHDQLVTEATDTYTLLLRIEDKYIKEQAKLRQVDLGSHSKLSGHQLLDLIDLHRSYLFEVYYIIAVSQHPAANPLLQDFALHRRLSTRMFRYVIQPLLLFLEVESRSSLLSFLRLSYSVATLLYETSPKLTAEWVEYLYELARVFKDIDTESKATWEKRIQHWGSLRDPSATDILQADVSDVLLADAAISTTSTLYLTDII